MKVHIRKGSDMFAQIRQQKIHLPALCGGKEKCGKCKVRLVEGVLPVTQAEHRLLSEEECKQGVRLACCHRCCEEDVVVELAVTEETEGAIILGAEQEQYETTHSEDGVGIAVDIGTTTLAMAVIDLRDGRCMEEIKRINPQRIYGADVLNRIQACREHGVRALQYMILQEVEAVVRRVISTGYELRRMVVCGNSTMEHIFLGIDPQKIREYPYTCEFIETQVVDSQSLFGRSVSSFPVIVLPNMAAFVGGDIVAGLVHTDMDHQDRRLLIDLGTNGEMALSHEGKLYTTSTAAGPAFEGGNMLCGVASVPGAICGIQMDGEEVEYQMIGVSALQPELRDGQRMIPAPQPIGICGSGYIEGISEILSQGWMDETGYMEQEVEIEGAICIVPADIRNFQLAKSAVRSGINILLQTAGVGLKEVEEVYISGGFGKTSNLAALANLKIIPKEFIAKTRLLGNTALGGAIRVLLEHNLERLEEVKARGINVDLASDPRFRDEYIRNMGF